MGACISTYNQTSKITTTRHKRHKRHRNKQRIQRNKATKDTRQQGNQTTNSDKHQIQTNSKLRQHTKTTKPQLQLVTDSPFYSSFFST